MDTNIHDVEAAGDVFDKVAEGSDDITKAEDAIAMLEELGRVMNKIQSARSMVKTQLQKLLDSPVQIGGKVWLMQNEYKQRPDHEAVRKAILGLATVNEDGEVRSAGEAAVMAYELTKRCYIEPSGLPKVEGLKRLGLDRAAVTHKELVGKKVTAIDVQGDDDE
jgi:hypothetical protein